jgi:hypothetical protein
MTTFTFHTDPSHGWLEVRVTELLKANLAPSDFSAYSYQQGDVVYLEEDCDAPVFIRSYEAHVGPISVAEKYSHYTHWIRNLPRIECIVDDGDLPF